MGVPFTRDMFAFRSDSDLAHRTRVHLFAATIG